MTRDNKAAGVASIGGAGETATGKSQSQYNPTTTTRQSQPQHGRVTGDVWSKTISKSAGQMLRQPAAIAVDASDLAAAELGGVRWLEVLERDNCQRYRVELSTFRACGFALERGAGKQWALTLDFWSIDGQPPRRQPAKPSVGAPLQLDLWSAAHER